MTASALRVPSLLRPLFWTLLALALAGAGWPTRAAAQRVRVEVGDPALVRDTLDARAAQPFHLRPFLLPGSETVYVDGARLEAGAYRLEPRHGYLWIPTLPDGARRVVVSYRTIPLDVAAAGRRQRPAGSEISAGPGGPVTEDGTEERADARAGAGSRLERSGSITRGILAGSNRDVSIESGLRMQLSGEVTEGVRVQAVLTDENTPILPEGTTQRLEEFDRVYIELASRPGTARLGDVDLRLDGSEFARLNRKVQGAALEGRFPGGGAAMTGGTLMVAGATTRGLFRMQEIEPVDGVQGPYRLRGSSGEPFILVIPGSETVYLDGRPLVRGETNDYVIDYATAEITFTARRLIAADHRITVEFQYSTSQYTRTLLAAHSAAGFWRDAAGHSRARFGATVLREADSRQFGTALELSPEDSLALVGHGDGALALSGAVAVSYDPEAPYTHYRREVRPRPDGAADTVYVAVTSAAGPDEPVYRVRFSYVGEGQGHYAREGHSVNGIVYAYRGEGGGAYDPVRLVASPRERRLVDVTGAVEPLAGFELFGEWAHSGNDENRLSPLDGGDDLGHAYLAGVRLRPTPLRAGDHRLGSLRFEASRRATGRHFTSFDRIRPIEFGRRWNLVGRPLDATRGVEGGGDEVVDEALLAWTFSPRSGLSAELGQIELGSAFEGRRSAAELRLEEAGVPQLDYRLEAVESRDGLLDERGVWVRQLGALRQPLLGGRLVPAVEVEQERRRQRVAGTDSLTRASFAFVELRPGLSWNTEALELGGHVEWRTEEAWQRGALRPAGTAWTTSLRFAYRSGPRLRTDGQIGVRRRRYEEYFRIVEQRQEGASVVVHWNTLFQPLGKAIQLSSSYEALTERTPRLQEIYLRTGPELGEFVWEDDGDGVVEIEEMIPERTPNEGVYARMFIPSETLESAIGVEARVRLEFDPARRWREPSNAWQRWLTEVSTRTTVDIREKSRDPDLARIYLLDLRRFRSPESTLEGRVRIAQDVFLFRRSPRLGIDLSFNELRGLTELAAGEEARTYRSWRAESRYKPSTPWALKLHVTSERNRVHNAKFATRRYDIRSVGLEPQAAYSPGRSWQFIAGVALARKRDEAAGRGARLVRVPLEVRLTEARRFSATARAEWASVDVAGAASGLALYELTEGRGPGRSLLWNLSGSYALTHYLRATVSYDGRAPAEGPAIHTGRLQLSAMF